MFNQKIPKKYRQFCYVMAYGHFADMLNPDRPKAPTFNWENFPKEVREHAECNISISIDVKSGSKMELMILDQCEEFAKDILKRSGVCYWDKQQKTMSVTLDQLDKLVHKLNEEIYGIEFGIAVELYSSGYIYGISMNDMLLYDPEAESLSEEEEEIVQIERICRNKIIDFCEYMGDVAKTMKKNMI